MSNFFRGALYLIQGEGGSIYDGSAHPLIGKELLIGDTKLRVKSLIAEGGFALVFAAQDQSGRSYALKQQIANDKDALSALSNEIAVMEELRGHPNIVGYYNTAKTRAANGGTEFMILMELCTGGSVIDLLKMGPLSSTQVLRIFYAACRAVKHMHCRGKPITHRDIKMQRNTTPMYRAPEISDEYMNMPVGPQQDVWALGCVLFYLCYRVHPFEDSAKLRIINAKYSIPVGDETYTMFVPLIQSCLRPNPMDRPTIADLAERTEALAAAMDIAPGEAVPGLAVLNPPSDRVAPEREGPPRSVRQEASPDVSAMFGALKGQGLNLFKQIKDRSAAVVQTVQATYGSGPDTVWISSRMMLAPLPDLVPEALAGQAEETLRNFVTSQGRPFLMVNFSGRRLRCEYLNVSLENMLPPVLPGPPPTVNYLLKMCRSMTQFLRQQPNGFVVLYGLMPHCALLSAALILYNRLLPRPMNAFELVIARRKTVTLLPPSFHRVLDNFKKVVQSDPSQIRSAVVHNRPVYMLGVVMEPSPLFNVNRTGCRPFAEVYCGGSKLWSTCKDYEQLRSFESPDGRAEIVFDKLPVGDDVTIVVYHARFSKMQNKMQQIFMFSFGFHANFCDPNQRELTFHLGDLDIKDSEKANFPDNFKESNRLRLYLWPIPGPVNLISYPLFIFPGLALGMLANGGYLPLNRKPHILRRVLLKLQIDNADRGFDSSMATPPEFLGYQPDTVSGNYLVDGRQEYEEITAEFGGRDQAPLQRRPSPRAEPPPPSDDFFNTLSWGHGHPETAPVSQPEVDLFRYQEAPPRPEPPARPEKPSGRLTAEDHERMAGIRVGKTEVDEDLSRYQFDCDKTNETPILGEPSPVQATTQPSDIDLLGLGEMNIRSSQQTKPASNVADPFADLLGGSSAFQPAPSSQDLFGDFMSTPAPSAVPMHRNVSAPSFAQSGGSSLDPFAEFMNSTARSNPNSGGSSAVNTPKQSRPNYSRAAFDSLNSSNTSAKSKVTPNAFEDLLSGHGFSTSSFAGTPKSMADLQRAEEVKTMDPVQIKMRDWTKGKEKNIRALLGSLNDVLWEGADKWQQPSMAELLQSSQIKKWYRKACLVVHPDKQTGTPHEELARAIFTQLNLSWAAYEENPDI